MNIDEAKTFLVGILPANELIHLNEKAQALIDNYQEQVLFEHARDKKGELKGVNKKFREQIKEFYAREEMKELDGTPCVRKANPF